MTERNAVLREGLGKLHTGQVLIVVSAVLIFIPLINLIGIIVALVGAVYSWLGLWKLKDVHATYGTGLYLVLGNLALSILGGMIGGSVETILELVSAGLSFGLTYCIITGTNEYLTEAGAVSTVARGVTSIKIYLATTVLSLVLTLLPAGLDSMALLVLAIGAEAAALAGTIYYIGYLGEAKACF